MLERAILPKSFRRTDRAKHTAESITSSFLGLDDQEVEFVPSSFGRVLGEWFPWLLVASCSQSPPENVIGLPLSIHLLSSIPTHAVQPSSVIVRAFSFLYCILLYEL